MVIPEFEAYVSELRRCLQVEAPLKDDIAEELRQGLYDKYNAGLIKGMDSAQSVRETMACFEGPVQLAAQFNRVHNGIPILSTVSSMLSRTPVIAAVLALTLITLLL